MLVSTLFLINLFICVINSNENLSELDVKKHYFIDFYAPWCGHCKHFEPIFDELSIIIRRDIPEIIPLKIDATYHTGLAKKYGVNSYPSIKYIHGDKIIEYHGERSINTIVEFLLRIHGPYEKEIKSLKEFSRIFHLLKDKPIFILVKENVQFHEEFIKIFQEDNLIINFYKTSISFLPEKLVNMIEKTTETPSILVIKEGQISSFSPEKTSLHDWITKERLLAFPQVNGYNFWKFIGNLNEIQHKFDKLICIYIVEKSRKEGSDSQKFYDLTHEIAFDDQSLKKNFVHSWSDDMETFNNLLLTYSGIALPNLLVVNISDFSFYLLKDYDQAGRTQALLNKNVLMERLANLKSENDFFRFGTGNGFSMKIKRVFFSLSYNLVLMYNEAPIMTLFMTVIPFGAISMLLYICCCLSGDEEDVYRQKRLQNQNRAQQSEKSVHNQTIPHQYDKLVNNCQNSGQNEENIDASIKSLLEKAEATKRKSKKNLVSTVRLMSKEEVEQIQKNYDKLKKE